MYRSPALCYLRDDDDESLEEAYDYFRLAVDEAVELELASVGLFQTLWCLEQTTEAVAELCRFTRRRVAELYPAALAEIPRWEREKAEFPRPSTTRQRLRGRH